MEKIKMGKIVSAVGLKGEVKIFRYSDNREHFDCLTEIFIGDDLRKIGSVRYQKNLPVVALEGVGDRALAESLRGKEVYMRAADLKPLPEDTYYVRDLIGLAVFAEDGRILGEIADVIQNRTQDLYEIRRENGKSLLLPAVAEFIRSVDPAARRITVRLPEGLLEL